MPIAHESLYLPSDTLHGVTIEHTHENGTRSGTIRIDLTDGTTITANIIGVERTT